MLALQILAMKRVVAQTHPSLATTQTRAQLKRVTLHKVAYIPALIAMTQTHVRRIPAIPREDARTSQSLVTMATHVPQILAIPREDACTRLLSVNPQALVKLTLAIR